MRITESENISSAISNAVKIDGGTLGNPNDAELKPMLVVCEYMCGFRDSAGRSVKCADINFIADRNFQKLYERYKKDSNNDALFIALKERVFLIMKIHCRENDEKLIWTEIKGVETI